MRFQLLGHVQGWIEDKAIPLGARKQRFVFALLALEANRLVPVSRLVDLIWPESPPGSARAMIHTYVSGLRRVLDQHGAAASDVSVISESAGYELRCEPARVDAHRFRDLVAQARAEPDPERRAAILTEALGLWRGPALAGVTVEATRVRLTRHLEEARLVAVEDRAEALLHTGQHADLVDELLTVADAHPQRQRLVGHLMLALYRSGRAAEALRVFDRTRQDLAAELGLDPDDDLRRLHQAILRGDSDLLVPAPPAVAPPATDEPVDRPRQLPADLAIFTGRGDELRHLLDGGTGDPARPSVVTVIGGMAGIGKTTLAVHAAHRLTPYFPDGQVFLNLHGFTPGTAPVEPAAALDRMLRAFGVPGKKIPDGEEDRAALWRTTLADRKVLLVFDNAENERQIAPLLPGTGGCLVLITSRRRLTDLDDARLLDLAVLSPAEAVTLFARISGTTEPGAVLTGIVDAVGRLPLAIAIAAARLRSRPGWTPADLVERLGSLDELDVGQRSVTAAIDLSYRQLGEEQQRVVRLLGVHFGPDVDRHAVAALAALPPDRAESLLQDLVDAHLLSEPRPGRYEMHDLVRAYAAASTPEPGASHRLLDHYRYGAWLACEALYPNERLRRPTLTPPAMALPAFDGIETAGAWLDEERANLLAAVEYAAQQGFPVHALHLSQTLHRHYEVRSLYTDAEHVHALALASAIGSGDRAGEARTLLDLAAIAFHRGRYDEAVTHVAEAARIHDQTGPPSGGPAPRSVLGLVRWRQGRYDEAREHFESALEFYRQHGDFAGQSTTVLNLGILSGQTEHFDDAERWFREALRLSRVTGNRIAEGHALTNLSIAFGAADRHAEALDHLHQALDVHRDTRSLKGQADTLANIGLVLDRMGRPVEALARHEEALAIYRRSGNRAGELESLNDIGRTLLTTGHHDTAADRHGEALTLAIHTGDRYQQAQAHDGLGQVHQARGDLAEARESWRRAVDILTDLGLTEEAGKVSVRLEALPQHL